MLKEAELTIRANGEEGVGPLGGQRVDGARGHQQQGQELLISGPRHRYQASLKNKLHIL